MFFFFWGGGTNVRCCKTAIIRAKCGGVVQHSPLNLEPLDTHDKSVTPQGSHLSVESSLSCVPSATGQFHWKSSWLGKSLGMLVLETIDAPPWLCSPCLTSLSPSCAQHQVHHREPFGPKRASTSAGTGGFTRRDHPWTRGWRVEGSRGV